LPKVHTRFLDEMIIGKSAKGQ